MEEAAEEAEFVLEYLDGYDLTYPVVFDWEVIGTESARTYGLDTETLCACANTFCSMVEEAGYEAMIYLTSYAGYIKYDLSQVMEYMTSGLRNTAIHRISIMIFKCGSILPLGVWMEFPAMWI